MVKICPQKWNASESPGSTSAADRPSRREPHQGAADARRESHGATCCAPASRSPRRDGQAPTGSLPSRPSLEPSATGTPVRPPAVRRCEHALELREAVEGALGENRPGDVEGDREGAAGHAEVAPDLGIGDLVEARHRYLRVVRDALHRGRQGLAEVTALRGEDRKPDGVVRPARPERKPGCQRLCAGADLGALPRDLERPLGAELEPEHPDLAGEGEHSDGQPGACEPARRRSRSRASPRWRSRRRRRKA